MAIPGTTANHAHPYSRNARRGRRLITLAIGVALCATITACNGGVPVIPPAPTVTGYLVEQPLAERQNCTPAMDVNATIGKLPYSRSAVCGQGRTAKKDMALRWRLKAKYAQLSVHVGVPDGQPAAARVRVSVYADGGRLLHRTAWLAPGQVAHVKANVHDTTHVAFAITQQGTNSAAWASVALGAGRFYPAGTLSGSTS